MQQDPACGLQGKTLRPPPAPGRAPRDLPARVSIPAGAGARTASEASYLGGSDPRDPRLAPLLRIPRQPPGRVSPRGSFPHPPVPPATTLALDPLSFHPPPFLTHSFESSPLALRGAPGCPLLAPPPRLIPPRPHSPGVRSPGLLLRDSRVYYAGQPTLPATRAARVALLGGLRRYYPVPSQPDAPRPGLASPSLTRLSLSGRGPSGARGPSSRGVLAPAFAFGAGRRVPAAARGPLDRCPRGSPANLGTLGASEGETGRGRTLGSQTRASSRYREEGGAARVAARPEESGALDPRVRGAGQWRGRGLGPPLGAGTQLPASPHLGGMKGTCEMPLALPLGKQR